MEKAGYKFAPGVAEELVDELYTIPPPSLTRKAAPTVIEGVQPIQLQIVCSYLFHSLPPGASLVTFDVSDVDSYVDRGNNRIL